MNAFPSSLVPRPSALAKRNAKLCFIGNSHAAHHLSEAASEKGFELVGPEQADVVFVSQDTPIDEHGRRDQEPIRRLVMEAQKARRGSAALVVTSQVEPGFMASLGIRDAHHQVELLRIRDAGERARHPEMMVVGFHPDRQWHTDGDYGEYLDAFACPVIKMDWQEAEFVKIAINTALAAQVDYANRMKAACDRLNIGWDTVKEAVHLDSRIGPHAYLEPGRWQDSKHLLRDAVTLANIEYQE